MNPNRWSSDTALAFPCYASCDIFYVIALLQRTTLDVYANGSHFNKLARSKNQSIHLSFIAVAMKSRDQYKIIGLHKISHFKKQPCRNVCLEKVL